MLFHDSAENKQVEYGFSNRDLLFDNKMFEWCLWSTVKDSVSSDYDDNDEIFTFWLHMTPASSLSYAKQSTFWRKKRIFLLFCVYEYETFCFLLL